jgi:hypothetical protein
MQIKIAFPRDLLTNKPAVTTFNLRRIINEDMFVDDKLMSFPVSSTMRKIIKVSFSFCFNELF